MTQVGAAVCAYLDGRKVVDLWAGVAGYVMNHLRFDLTGDPRSETLVRAARAAAG